MKKYDSLGGWFVGDAEQFWFALIARVKEHYPINGVPPEVEETLHDLVGRAQALVRDGGKFIDESLKDLHP